MSNTKQCNEYNNTKYKHFNVVLGDSEFFTKDLKISDDVYCSWDFKKLHELQWYYYQITDPLEEIPPSIVTIVPVIYPASGEARKAHKSATSLTVAGLLAG